MERIQKEMTGGEREGRKPRIKDLPPSERPYELLEEKGAQTLTDAQLLAVLLQSGTVGETSVEMALRLLSQCSGEGSDPLVRLCSLRLEELRAFKGMGRVKAIKVKAAFELAVRLSNRQVSSHIRLNTPEDLAECHAIRCEVFCQEQGLFNGVDDTDERDPYAVHILARVNGEAAGVVRCFRRSEGVWVGGRLAVRKRYRSHLGALLVRRAVSTMEERGDVRRFFAVVQIQNLHFFEFLQWKPLGIPFLCHGVLHQVMEKPFGTGE